VGEGFGAWRSEPLPLGSLFVLQRLEEAPVPDPTVERLQGRAAWQALSQHSYIAPLVSPLKLHQGRLDRLARIVEAVPVWKLTYGTGLDRLGALSDTIDAITSETEPPCTASPTMDE
jgi:hypothetical protein